MGCGLANKRIKIYSTNIEKATISKFALKSSENTRISNTHINQHNKTNCDIYSEYKILDKIGSGTYGRVYKVEELRTGITRAMKIIKKKDIQSEKEAKPKENEMLLTEKNEFLDEIKILNSLEHPNIIKMIDYFYDNNFVYIILEFFPYGDLCDEISNWKIYSEEKACQIIYQILIGLNYLHSNCIIHRDLKPENIILIKNEKSSSNSKNSLYNYNNNFSDYGKKLFFNYEDHKTDKYLGNVNLQINDNKEKKLLNESIYNDYIYIHKNNNNNNDSSINIKNKLIYESNLQKSEIKNANNPNTCVNIKIIDFGTGKVIEKNKYLHSINGTPHYLAPEMINSYYDEKVDIWSCGVIFYFMLVGYLPFKGKTVTELIETIERGKYEMNNNDWKNISTEVKHLLRCMLTYCPKKRISASDALNLTIFKKIQKNVFGSNGNEVRILKKTLENLRKANIINKLREATFSYLIHYFTTNKELAKLNSAFKKLDENNDGKISFDELQAGCDFIFGENLSDIELRMLMDHMDYDKNGYIEYSEFIKMFFDTKLLADEIKLKSAFDNFDLNKDGKLSREEVINIFSYDAENLYLKKMNNNDDKIEAIVPTRRRINFNLDCSVDKIKIKGEGIDFIHFKEIMLKYLERNEHSEVESILNASNFKNYLEDSSYLTSCSSDFNNNNKNNKLNSHKNVLNDSKNKFEKRSNLKKNFSKNMNTRSKSDESNQLITNNISDCNTKKSNNSIIQINASIDSKDNEKQKTVNWSSNNQSESVFLKKFDNLIINKKENFDMQKENTSNIGIRKTKSSQNFNKYMNNSWPFTQKDLYLVSNFYYKTLEKDEKKFELSEENKFYFKKLKSYEIEDFNLLEFNKNN